MVINKQPVDLQSIHTYKHIQICLSSTQNVFHTCLCDVGLSLIAFDSMFEVDSFVFNACKHVSSSYRQHRGTRRLWRSWRSCHIGWLTSWFGAVYWIASLQCSLWQRPPTQTWYPAWHRTKICGLFRRTSSTVMTHPLTRSHTRDVDERAQTVPWIDHFSGVPPKESSFLINALLLHHYKRGAYYPRGGASEFAFHIIPVIQQGGGAVLVRAPVQRVLLNQDGKACGKRERFNLRGDAWASHFGLSRPVVPNPGAVDRLPFQKTKILFKSGTFSLWGNNDNHCTTAS